MKEANLNRKKNTVIAFWLVWEKIFNSVFSLRSIDDENELLHYRIRKYRGRTIQFDNGIVLKRGDKVAELHLNNKLMFSAFAASRSSVHLAVRLLREVEPLMTKLSAIMKNDVKEDVKALYGVSMIYRGTEQLGFTIKDMPSGPFSFLSNFYLKLLLIGLHPQGRKRIQNHPEMWKPKLIVMPTSVLFSKYEKSQ